MEYLQSKLKIYIMSEITILLMSIKWLFIVYEYICPKITN